MKGVAKCCLLKVQNFLEHCPRSHFRYCFFASLTPYWPPSYFSFSKGNFCWSAATYYGYEWNSRLPLSVVLRCTVSIFSNFSAWLTTLLETPNPAPSWQCSTLVVPSCLCHSIPFPLTLWLTLFHWPSFVQTVWSPVFAIRDNLSCRFREDCLSKIGPNSTLMEQSKKRRLWLSFSSLNFPFCCNNFTPTLTFYWHFN